MGLGLNNGHRMNGKGRGARFGSILGLSLLWLRRDARGASVGPSEAGDRRRHDGGWARLSLVLVSEPRHIYRPVPGPVRPLRCH